MRKKCCKVRRGVHAVSACTEYLQLDLRGGFAE
jgi:hypothetical protein